VPEIPTNTKERRNWRGPCHGLSRYYRWPNFGEKEKIQNSKRAEFFNLGINFK
jgi:hypothetical protein